MSRGLRIGSKSDVLKNLRALLRHSRAANASNKEWTSLVISQVVFHLYIL